MASREALLVFLQSLQRKSYYDILLEASRNPALAVLSGSLRTIAARILEPMQYSNEWREESLALRRALMRALAMGDPGEAEKRMLEFRSASRKYISTLDPTIFERPIDILTLDLDED